MAASRWATNAKGTEVVDFAGERRDFYERQVGRRENKAPRRQDTLDFESSAEWGAATGQAQAHNRGYFVDVTQAGATELDAQQGRVCKAP
jgi:hypothetical protein